MPLHSSLIRPLLLAGGERLLVMMNGLIIIMLLLGVGLNTFTIVTAILLATFGQWGLVQAAKADPQMSEIYRRHIRYRDFYPAQSSVQAKTPVIYPSIPKIFIK